ncbi:ABC transporter substrate-binding protein [Nocardia sp. NPDC048505]|uniref:ABC transporter substrate-binding protein n=1 Tax=unclassified Nocardia TaxID=2637762 RepID=UPI0033D483C6
MASRRAVLQAGAILPLVTACAPSVLLGRSGVVRIAVSWSGTELAAFRDLLDGVAGTTPVEVIPLGDEIETAFAAGGTTAPDIVMLPRAGRVQDLAERGRLQSIPPEWWAGEYPDYWRPLLTHHGRLYGVPFKVADKSMVWYDREAVAEHGLGDPETWTLPYLTGTARDRLAGTSWRLLALAAADGWVLTDLFENLLRSADPATYDRLANAAAGQRDWRSPGIAQALEHFGRLCGGEQALLGGVGASLTRQFPDAVHEVFERRRAVLFIGPDFAEPVVRRSLVRSRRPMDVVGVADFPRVALEKARPHIIGGDIIVLTQRAGESARAIAARLAGPRAPLPWIEGHGGFLAANQLAPAAYSAWLAPRAAALAARTAPPDAKQTAGTEQLAFDLSDRIGAVGGRNGLWRTLTEFLVAVGGSTPVPVAAERAIADLAELEGRQR